MAKEVHDDVAFIILSKLPLKSLNRFICVHKSWAYLLKNPYFMNMFRTNFLSKHHSYYDDTSLLLQTNCTRNSHSVLYFLSGDKFENRVKLDWPPPIQEEYGRNYIEICGSAIHGTFCLSSGISMKKFALWNPATEEFKFIPCSPLESLPHPHVMTTSYGFGYDPIGDDFKVIRNLEYDSYNSWTIIPSSCWEIYSLRCNSWKKLNMLGDYGTDDMGYNINGVCHWLSISDKRGEEKHLVSFNLSNEVFFTTPLPLDMSDRMVQKSLVAINGSIAVISSKYKETTFHISILGELCVKESWIKLLIVGPLLGNPRPIGVGKKGIFFRKENGELALFDLSTQMLEEIASEGNVGCREIIIYKENILPFGS